MSEDLLPCLSLVCLDKFQSLSELFVLETKVGESRLHLELHYIFLKLLLSLISSSEDSSMYLNLNRGSNKDDKSQSATKVLQFISNTISRKYTR